ncbi:MAG: VOC family protein [Pseudolysinimonas sp.]|uniref:VOC family protein n=1 Tax=Pseudolysinimonas sp. TaxID=2680009 RepID=UPI0032676B38
MTGISAITLFVEDLAVARDWYDRVFSPPEYFGDDVAAAFKVGETIVNLLQVTEAPDLMAPAQVGTATAGVRALMTIDVEDVDTRVAELKDAGIPILNGPMNRPWGIRTASFLDPSGHAWELSGPVS